ncbi:hypothetical protein N7481_010904 [Penicillium waksmanii]|uniref:uncharacterized protein n=1 Tax=Penicillium waksmanii TaxID=69791 RepID=UPI0025497CE1|nr:uncharacterized protein N7481_010904 [Penicillium waksmanii]KAJ5973694.1 hypothetical protein N7481_010904 [Penicillium waksmanii]
MVKVMTNVSAVVPSVLDDVLDREGMDEIDVIYEDMKVSDEDDDEENENNAHSTESLGEPTATESHSPTENFESSTHSLDYIIARQAPMAPPSPRPSPYPLIPVFSPNHALQDEESENQDVLNHIISAARRDPFPSRGIFNMDHLNQALREVMGDEQYEGFDGPGVVGAFRSSSQLERDKKIRAAGELYVNTKFP